jgi:hypothetical protein
MRGPTILQSRATRPGLFEAFRCPGRARSTSQSFGYAAAYFNELLIEVNLVLSLVPSPFTTAIIASAMPAAISPYSMAVAPVSSARNL